MNAQRKTIVTMISGPTGTTWRLAGNDNESVVQDDDTEGHRLAGNDNETITPGARRLVGDADGEGDGTDDPQQAGLRR